MRQGLCSRPPSKSTVPPPPTHIYAHASGSQRPTLYVFLFLCPVFYMSSGDPNTHRSSPLDGKCLAKGVISPKPPRLSYS